MPRPGGEAGHEPTGRWSWGDGAEWIWNQADLHFPETTQIVDLYHAREHLWDLAAKLYPNDSPAQSRWVMVRKDKLDEGKIEALVRYLRLLAASDPELAEEIRTGANYFESNKESMRYPEFRKQQLFVGSGVIEAWCKTSWVDSSSPACSGRCAALMRLSLSGAVS